MLRKCLLLALSFSGLSFGAASAAPFIVKQVEAVIGRPLTPMSYAGVARRTTRRAVYATAAVTTAPYYAPYGAPYAPYYW